MQWDTLLQLTDLEWIPLVLYDDGDCVQPDEGNGNKYNNNKFI